MPFFTTHGGFFLTLFPLPFQACCNEKIYRDGPSHEPDDFPPQSAGQSFFPSPSGPGGRMIESPFSLDRVTPEACHGQTTRSLVYFLLERCRLLLWHFFFFPPRQARTEEKASSATAGKATSPPPIPFFFSPNTPLFVKKNRALPDRYAFFLRARCFRSISSSLSFWSPLSSIELLKRSFSPPPFVFGWLTCTSLLSPFFRRSIF